MSSQISLPLVSIIVITYNSSLYVKETLESIKSQTYQHLELIISDDCSTDGTVEICERWLSLNTRRFVRSQLIKSAVNQGVCRNANKGIACASGEWIKFIGGDDSLLRNSIEKLLDFAIATNYQIIHSDMLIYRDHIRDDNFVRVHSSKDQPFNAPMITAALQYELLLRSVWIAAPSTFFSMKLMKSVGGFDEQMPFEDLPFFLNVTNLGYKQVFMHKCLEMCTILL